MGERMRKQIPNTEANRNIISNAENSEKAMMILLFIAIVLTLVFGRAMKYYMYLIRIL
jgi:hypothetical protein